MYAHIRRKRLIRNRSDLLFSLPLNCYIPPPRGTSPLCLTKHERVATFLIAALLPEQHRLSDQDTPWQYCKLVTFSEANTGRPVKTGCNIIFAARRSHCCCAVSTAFLSVDSCNSMLSTEARVSPKNRDKGLHSLRTSTVEVPSFIFFVVTLGTFRRQAAEDLRVYVRGQKMIDSLGCKGGVKTFSAFRTLRTTELCCKLQQDIHF